MKARPASSVASSAHRAGQAVPLAVALAVALAALPGPAGGARADDVNSFRARHGRPPLAYSASLAALAQQQASAMARRGRLDHKNFRERTRHIGATVAENVSWGCDDAPCAIRQWSRSAGHRRNMLRGDVSHYGIASATADNGRRYWALTLGGE